MKEICKHEKIIVELYRYKLDDFTLDFRDVLYKLYINQDKSIRELASELDVSPASISKWLKELGITKLRPTC